MGKYERKDHYYRKAKEKGLPSRASFKIEEILNKFRILHPGDTVLDLGAAPGGWTVMLAKAVGPQGKVLALDLKTLPRVQGPNIHFSQADIYSEEARQWLEEQLGSKKIGLICSDMSPKLSGIDFKDAYLSYEIGMKALEVAKAYLKPGGHFVTKIFPGVEFPQFLKELRQNFDKVKTFDPQSSRKTSREVYLLGMGFKSIGAPNFI